MLTSEIRMNDEKLKMVCGADNGDTALDNNPNQSMYEVGQDVEVYTTGLHLGTNRTHIDKKVFENGHWKYAHYRQVSVRNVKFSIQENWDKWFTADDIER